MRETRDVNSNRNAASSTTKCNGCGLESNQSELFQSVPRSFSKKHRTLCPVCLKGRDDRVCLIVFWGSITLLLVGAILTLFLPSMSLGPVLLNIALIQVFVFVCTVLHELGHACAGRLVGFRVFGIEIGKGRVISEFFFGGLHWQFRAIPFGGCVHGAPRDTRQYRLKESVFVLGGPLANVALLAVAIWVLPVEQVLDSGVFKGFTPATMFLLSNVTLLAYSLWPYRIESRHGKIPNDILLLWETWRRPRAEVKQLPANCYLLEAQESQRRGCWEEASKWIEEGLRLFPNNYWLEWMQASNFVHLKQYADARQAYVLLLGRYSETEEIRYTLLNNIAYVDTLIGNPELLVEADAYSRMVVEKMPWNFYFKGTRGSVLVELGQIDEGLKLLRQALKQHTEPQGQALNACYIGIGEARRGNLTESHEFFSMARRLDSKCFLLAREVMSS